MPTSGFLQSSAGRPFTLWLDPARWPVPALRLPGRAFTVWLDPARWPVPAMRLPGRAFTVWLDEARWPVPRLRLTGAGFTLWMDPETWPASSELSQMVSPLTPAMPIQIPQNKAFTLWTRPSQVTPIPMRNGLTAAGLAATGTAPGEMATPAAVVPDRTAAIGTPAAVTVTPLAHRLLPLAAGIVAVLGLNALISAADSKKASVVESDLAQLRQQLDQTSRSMVENNVRNSKVSEDFEAKAARIEAKALALQQENDRMVKSLKQAEETIRQGDAKGREQDGLVRKLQQELSQATSLAASADHKAQTAVVAAMEEASGIKRESAAAVVTLRETLARLEAEKAAALKAAAEAAGALAKLQAEIPSAPKR